MEWRQSGNQRGKKIFVKWFHELNRKGDQQVLSMLMLKRCSSESEEDKLMWDYCTPGPEALERKVTTTHNFQIFDIILHDLTLFYTVLHHRTIMPSLSGSITKTFQQELFIYEQFLLYTTLLKSIKLRT